MNASSPVKRRVLGALDPNACSPSKVTKRHEGKLFLRSPTKVVKSVPPRPALVEVTSPTRVARVPVPVPAPSVVPGTPEKEMEMGTESRKRRSPTPTFTTTPVLNSAAAQDGEPAAKRACLESAREETHGRRPDSPPSSSWTTRTSGTTRPRSASPDTPSVFDNSAADNSQVTILTEPDTTAPAPFPAVAPLPAPRARPRLTREQAREKAEIIRLRLGLASYKVRTGQTDVPLDRLEAQHARASFSSPPLPSKSLSPSQIQGRNRSSTAVSASFPPPANVSFTSTIATTPGRNGSSRRPLPGAPLRRTSSSASVSFEQQDMAREAPPSRSVLYEEARLAIARDERRQQQHQQQPHNQHHHQQSQHQQHPHQHLPQLPRHNHNTQHNAHHHQRRQSEALGTRHDARRYMYGAEYSAVPPRPRTAVGVTGSSSVSFGRRVSFVDDERDDVRDRDNGRDRYEDEDLEGRGGAASGLLSLARS